MTGKSTKARHFASPHPAALSAGTVTGLLPCLLLCIAVAHAAPPSQYPDATTCVLSGKVRDVDSGKPLPHIRISSRVIAERGTAAIGESVSHLTDVNGRFRIVVPAKRVINLAFDLQSKGEYLIDEKWIRSSLTRHTFFNQAVGKDITDMEIPLKLVPIRTVNGRVVDGKGEGIEDAVIFVQQFGPEVRTQKGGGFVLPTVPKKGDFGVFVQDADSRRARFFHVRDGSSSLTLALDPTRDFAGIVTTENGVAASNLSFIMCVRANESDDVAAAKVLVTDAGGRFHVVGLCPGAVYRAWWSSNARENSAYERGSAVLDISRLRADEPIRFRVKLKTP